MTQELLHPALSPEMNTIVLRLQREDIAVPDPTTLPPDQAREIAELTNRRWNRDLPKMGQVATVGFPSPQGHDISSRLFIPKDVQPGLIFFIHGGGFAFCSVDTHESAARSLAREAQCSVLSVSYRLAPEHPFPAGLNDCIAVFDQLSQLYSDFPITDGPLAVAGDSAGANLALALMLSQQTRGAQLPDFAMLFYGVYGADFQSKSYIEFAQGPGLTRDKMIRFLDWYAPIDQRHDPLVCPIMAPDEALKALPSMYLNAAEVDPLYSDTIDFSARLKALGRKDQLQIYKGVVHGFMQMTSCLSDARKTTEEAANAFRKHVENT